MSASAPSTNPMTLTRHIIAEQRTHPDAHGDLTMLLQSVQLACKTISSAIRKASLINLYGLAGETNVQGEDVKKLDVLSNDLFINTLSFSGAVGVMISEEEETELVVGAAGRVLRGEGAVLHDASGKYAVVFDPLDGSSNIDAGVSVGTIFGIYRHDSGPEAGVKDVLRSGDSMVAAGYAMYGSSTMLVLTTGNGVNGFTLDPEIGEFILTHEKLRIPERGSIYSINEGNTRFWDATVRAYVAEKKDPAAEGAKPYSLRYIGSMVADVHRTILYGGIFMYPADSKSTSGKLRVLYECFPMAMICEQAGGAASDGKRRILELVPSKFHQRSPIFLGSKEDVADIERAYNAAA
eukprot:TRINITY_DN7462_c2_g2_i2.p1 TRINITY_DN7462_c2_g2~~TRINITY_DN7462_c2_g2_i2.p1  ORF type:complete len:351 (-),score=157.61 TRINITY_DN7462_c2_g2_i2:125-1177(-)